MDIQSPNQPGLTRRQARERGRRKKRGAPGRTLATTTRNRLSLRSGVVTVLLIFATSTPALAVSPSPGLASLAPAAHEDLPGQTLATTAGAPTIVVRDGFDATSEKDLATLQTGRTASTFTNSIDSAVQWPFTTDVPISDGYGPRDAPCSGCSTFHKGLDLTPGEGSPIQAISDGVVRETGESDSGFGVYAVIDHIVEGELVSSLYAHMQAGSLQVEEGQPVKAGQLVGDVGSTGQSTGPHLHLELLLNGTQPIDPYAWLAARVSL
ncbi:M23 family metallopeptidase [Cryobacterium zhongshanensis]|uniref:M23 family metallopeptidase n=1 Tax=Cryobacterium zhongshanensis TaxID=2928153 RepID=A0AA41QWG8_9MICO|nr:M23 family metallopeptidase [Cryobacterium zhongshanensis]MCI4658467.1 M23 family metallopeptidase [Cryobacterium zhongshanensis]